jgi:hypothetical protein
MDGVIPIQNRLENVSRRLNVHSVWRGIRPTRRCTHLDSNVRWNLRICHQLPNQIVMPDVMQYVQVKNFETLAAIDIVPDPVLWTQGCLMRRRVGHIVDGLRSA